MTTTFYYDKNNSINISMETEPSPTPTPTPSQTTLGNATFKTIGTTSPKDYIIPFKLFTKVTTSGVTIPAQSCIITNSTSIYGNKIIRMITNSETTDSSITTENPLYYYTFPDTIYANNHLMGFLTVYDLTPFESTGMYVDDLRGSGNGDITKNDSTLYKINIQMTVNNRQIYFNSYDQLEGLPTE